MAETQKNSGAENTGSAGNAGGNSAVNSSVDYQALADKLLEMETSVQMQKIRQLMLLRTALESEVAATRMPVPKNITEVGGYYNLLAKQQEQSMMRQLVASAVGIPSDVAPDLTEKLIRKLITEILEGST